MLFRKIAHSRWHNVRNSRFILEKLFFAQEENYLNGNGKGASCRLTLMRTGMRGGRGMPEKQQPRTAWAWIGGALIAAALIAAGIAEYFYSHSPK